MKHEVSFENKNGETIKLTSSSTDDDNINIVIGDSYIEVDKKEIQKALTIITRPTEPNINTCSPQLNSRVVLL